MKTRLVLTFMAITSSLFSSSGCHAAEKFFFGASNAAFQVEGSPKDSDWREWTKTKYPDGQAHIADGTNAEQVTDFWNRYEEDFKLAQANSMNAFRMSIAWERIEPEPGKWDDAALDHYAKMITTMKKHGLEPFITLQHYVLPLWVSRSGGLTWSAYPKHFGEFAKHVVTRLSKAGAVYFMTLNEPNIQVRFGYLDAHKFPPGINDPTEATKALAGLAKAHIQAYLAIHSTGLPVKVGLAHNWQIFDPFDPKSEDDIAIASQVDWMFNRAFLIAIMTGDIHFEMPGGKPVFETVELPSAKPTLDYLGIQNYGRSYVSRIAFPPGYNLVDGPRPGIEPPYTPVKNDLGWEVVPDALDRAVKQASRYGFPIIITETGIADRADKLRPEYLRKNFASLEKSLKDPSVKLFGYIHWSLTDNFEWAFGLAPCFGLVEIDYKAHSARKPRPSLGVYAKLIREFQKKHGAH